MTTGFRVRKKRERERCGIKFSIMTQIESKEPQEKRTFLVQKRGLKVCGISRKRITQNETSVAVRQRDVHMTYRRQAVLLILRFLLYHYTLSIRDSYVDAHMQLCFGLSSLLLFSPPSHFVIQNNTWMTECQILSLCYAHDFPLCGIDYFSQDILRWLLGMIWMDRLTQWK